jgi:hypothetical protein
MKILGILHDIRIFFIGKRFLNIPANVEGLTIMVLSEIRNVCCKVPRTFLL